MISSDESSHINVTGRCESLSHHILKEMGRKSKIGNDFSPQDIQTPILSRRSCCESTRSSLELQPVCWPCLKNVMGGYIMASRANHIHCFYLFLVLHFLIQSESHHMLFIAPKKLLSHAVMKNVGSVEAQPLVFGQSWRWERSHGSRCCRGCWLRSTGSGKLEFSKCCVGEFSYTMAHL